MQTIQLSIWINVLKCIQARIKINDALKKLVSLLLWFKVFKQKCLKEKIKYFKRRNCSLVVVIYRPSNFVVFLQLLRLFITKFQKERKRQKRKRRKRNNEKESERKRMEKIVVGKTPLKKVLNERKKETD